MLNSEGDVNPRILNSEGDVNPRMLSSEGDIMGYKTRLKICLSCVLNILALWTNFLKYTYSLVS